MACLQWGPCCHPLAFLLAKGKLCYAKHTPEALFFSHEDKMGDDKKMFSQKCCYLMCYPPAHREVCFLHPWRHQGQVTNVADFSCESGVLVATSELSLLHRERVLNCLEWRHRSDVPSPQRDGAVVERFPSCPAGGGTSAWRSE